MVRTQIQLTEEQARSLREIARARDSSIAELIRTSVDGVLRSEPGPSREERRRRAIAAAGTFHSGVTDLSTDHDRHLGDIYSR